VKLVDRAKNLLLQPAAEWRAIDAEPHTVHELYTHYVMILAAIPAVSHFIGFSVIGTSLGGPGYRVPLAFGVAHMVTQYVLTLALVYVLAALIDGLAPGFGGEKDFGRSFKLAAFAPTAAWLAGIFHLVPAFSILGLLGLYSLYLLYVGVPILKRVPEDKAIPCVVVVLIGAIVMAVVVNGLAALMIPSTVRGF
jgi:hypothetical protein